MGLWKNIRFLAVTASLLFPLAAEAAETHIIEDVSGRKVEVPVQIDRLLLGESRYLATLAIFDRDDPVKRVVGMFGEFERLDPASYGEFLAKFPHIADVPRVGRTNENTFSVEQAIALKPQVAIFAIEGHGPTPQSTEILERLDSAGIKVLFIDFKRHPLQDTTKSIAIMGSLLGKQDIANAYNALYTSQLNIVLERVKGLKERPSVFIENRVGLSEECCEALAHGLFADYLEAAGGKNIADGIIPGIVGTLSMEFLLKAQPDVYIGTAIGAVKMRDPKRIILGVGADEATARASLRHVLERPGFSGLKAVKEKRAFSIWHHFYNSPFNVAAVQAMAKWLHPELFADLDPRGLLQKIYDDFQPVALNGAYWVSLDD